MKVISGHGGTTCWELCTLLSWPNRGHVSGSAVLGLLRSVASLSMGPPHSRRSGPVSLFYPNLVRLRVMRKNPEFSPYSSYSEDVVSANRDWSVVLADDKGLQP